jgi:hypothetical protein
MQASLVKGVNARVAKDNVSFASLGLTAPDIEIIYEMNGTAVRSWRPDRAVNRLQGFVKGMGYYIVAKNAIELPVVAAEQPLLVLKMTGLPEPVSHGVQELVVTLTNQSDIPVETDRTPLEVVISRHRGLFFDMDGGQVAERDEEHLIPFNNTLWQMEEAGEELILRLQEGMVVPPHESLAFMLACGYNEQPDAGVLDAFVRCRLNPYAFVSNTDQLFFRY